MRRQHQIHPLASAVRGFGRTHKGWYNMVAAEAKADATAEVFIYGEIGPWGITASNFVRDLRAALKGAKKLVVRVSSPGGSITDGIAIFNAIRDVNIEKVGINDAIAASMGSVIVLGCDRVLMRENALYMVHKPWTWAGGDAEELRKTANVLDKFENTLVGVYAKKTGKSEDEIRTLLAAETWYEAEEAKEAGFVDEVIDALDAEAWADLKLYDSFNPEDFELHNAPAALFTLFTRPEAAAKGQDNPQENDVKPKTIIDAQANAGAVPNAGGGAQNATPDPEALRAQFLKEEEARRAAVTAKFKGFEASHGELMRACLDDMKITPAEAGDKLLAALAVSAPGPVSNASRVEAGRTEGEKRAEGMTASILMRAGLQAHDRQNEFRGFNLRELAREALNAHGVRTGGMSALDMIAMAFTHSSGDFGSILSNVAEKAMLKGCEEADETFQVWTKRGTLSDFKVADRVGMAEFPLLDRVPEGGEYKHATLSDRAERIQLATYGKKFAITRQAIINDDLNAFVDVPRKMARAAQRTIGNLVYAVLTGSHLMADGKTLFHADHKNIGTAGALSAATLDAARTAFALQKDSDGNGTLNIRPKYLLVPVGLEGVAKVLLESETDPDQSNSKKPNKVRGLCEIVSDSRLDAASAAGYYLVADPNMHDTVEVAYLDGNDKPTLEQQNGWDVDGVEFKVRHDAGVKALDFRTVHKNAGQ